MIDGISGCVNIILIKYLKNLLRQNYYRIDKNSFFTSGSHNY